MSDDNAARAAIDGNDKENYGRRLAVNEARPREERTPGGYGPR